ncbi:hypothetical protein [Streptomyces cacaoi]|uniref:hypothetical protein n=1 Tax=Streptomyces cacaoi TaxID=1898 RepID=UPI0026313BE4|nr:hypothetical protein [Streptomyces cacaoi]
MFGLSGPLVGEAKNRTRAGASAAVGSAGRGRTGVEIDVSHWGPKASPCRSPSARATTRRVLLPHFDASSSRLCTSSIVYGSTSSSSRRGALAISAAQCSSQL